MASRWRMKGMLKRERSDNWQASFTTPVDIWNQRQRLQQLGVTLRGTQQFRLTTGTSDKFDAERWVVAKTGELLSEWTAYRELLRNGPVDLNHKQIVALVGEECRKFVQQHENDPAGLPQPEKILRFGLARLIGHGATDLYVGDAGEQFLLEMGKVPIYQWQEHLSAEFGNADTYRKRALQVALVALKWGVGFTISTIAQQALAKAGAIVSPATSQIIHRQAPVFLEKAHKSLASRLDGDYDPLKWETSLPAFEAGPPSSPATNKINVKISDLLELWNKEHLAAGKSSRTVRDWKQKVEDFTSWFGCDDATIVTSKNVADFADYLRDVRKVSASTIAGKYLAALSSIFKAGVARTRLELDPTAKVHVKVPKKIKERSSGFTDEEAQRILQLALSADTLSDRWSISNKAACKWIPWICAYTGARPGEIAQLRTVDVQEESGIPFLNITPEAGTVKTGEYRRVPIHEHLVELGFLDFVASRPADAPLFYDIIPGRKAQTTQSEEVVKKVRLWVRNEAKVDDPRIKPNHAWRHRFKTVGREAGIDVYYLDAIQGHFDGKARSQYGEATLKTLYREIEKIPKYDITARVNARC